MSKRASVHDQYRKGPPEAIQWLFVTRDSPVELDRKFGYIVGHHKALAKAESTFIAASKTAQCKSTRRDLMARVKNTKAWLDFSVATLTNHVRHALARCEPESADGKLLREEGTQRKRYGKKPLQFRRPRKKAEKRIRHYAIVLEEYKLSKAAAAGHSGSNDALTKLIQHAQVVIQKWANSSHQEKDDAEQAAICSLLKTAEAFDPTHQSMSRFNTLAWWKARRAVETRSTKDCKPGIAIIKQDGDKKLVTIASINSAPKNKDDAGDAWHPPVVERDAGCRMDVAQALEDLSKIERAAVVGVLMENKSLRQIMRETNFSARRLRDALDRGRLKLRYSLAAFE